eukprot:55143-Chlamydomonas_euryale.AAC.1
MPAPGPAPTAPQGRGAAGRAASPVRPEAPRVVAATAAARPPRPQHGWRAAPTARPLAPRPTRKT